MDTYCIIYPIDIGFTWSKSDWNGQKRSTSSTRKGFEISSRGAALVYYDALKISVATSDFFRMEIAMGAKADYTKKIHTKTTAPLQQKK